MKKLICPRCGSENAEAKGFFWHWVYCSDCELMTKDSYKTEEEAIKAWENMNAEFECNGACEIHYDKG